MNDADKALVVEAALKAGFLLLDDGSGARSKTLACTEDQLCNLMSIAASAVLEQADKKLRKALDPTWPNDPSQTEDEGVQVDDPRPPGIGIFMGGR